MSFSEILFTGINSPSEILPNLFLIQSWTPYTDPLSFNFPAWSISVEFYLYFLLFLSFSFRDSLRLFFWLTMFFVGCLLLFFNLDLWAENVARGFYSFFGGVLTYFVYVKISTFRVPVLTGSLLEISFISAIFFMVSFEFDLRSILNPVLFFLCLLLFSFESGCVSMLFKLYFFQMIGKLSYSIYMVHMGVLFCFSIFTMILEKVFFVQFRFTINSIVYHDFGNALWNNMAVIALLLLILVVSSLTYRFVEIPSQKLMRG